MKKIWNYIFSKKIDKAANEAAEEAEKTKTIAHILQKEYNEQHKQFKQTANKLAKQEYCYELERKNITLNNLKKGDLYVVPDAKGKYFLTNQSKLAYIDYKIEMNESWPPWPAFFKDRHFATFIKSQTALMFLGCLKINSNLLSVNHKSFLLHIATNISNRLSAQDVEIIYHEYEDVINNVPIFLYGKQKIYSWGISSTQY